ncbi:Rieske (2Fe-2S) protein [Calidifontibacillus erzurumensis]|uniref:Rieske (2Fe-2S) protein n=1 Tax=Calidifontibacillus erzurumensis TaxID=2741433 RepID=A0A8J8GGE3_9BACI|nr:Rieske (2Fe-2S) protein [Calidifontibacillus erzurumensis]NSL51845.1 Rieske (2Fe-2S) protein [Calidifontibacillus erzurumensis]
MDAIQKRTLNSIVVCPTEELGPGQRKLVIVDGLEIAIVNVEGNLYAFRNRCPHQGVEMGYGSIGGTLLPSEPGEYKYGCDNQIISCPLHGWEFEVSTGKSLHNPEKVSIGSYDVQEEDGSIVLKINREPKNVSVRNFNCSH